MPAQPPASATVEIDPDVFDWQGGDCGITARDAIVTPHGIAIACEEPVSQSIFTRHSLRLLDPTTRGKRDVYGIQEIEIDAMQLADADTLLLEGSNNDLFVVDLAATAPAPRRILVYAGGGQWMHGPRIVGNEVYVAHSHCGATTCSDTLERVALHGGPDQQPVIVAQLPIYGAHTLAAASSIYVLGEDLSGDGEPNRTVARVDLVADPVRVDLLLDPPGGPGLGLFRRGRGSRALAERGAARRVVGYHDDGDRLVRLPARVQLAGRRR